MAITRVAAANSGGSAVTQMTMPSPIAAGDVIVVFVMNMDNHTGITIGGSSTGIIQQAISTAAPGRWGAYTKTAVGTEAGATLARVGGSSTGSMVVAVYRNTTGTLVGDVGGVTQYTISPSDTPYGVPSLNRTDGGTGFSVVHGSTYSSSPSWISASSDLTAGPTSLDISTNIAGRVFESNGVVADPTGPSTVTMRNSGGSTAGAVMHVVLTANDSPTAPTLSPATGTKMSAPETSWTHNDPDGDAQAAWGLVRKRVIV